MTFSFGERFRLTVFGESHGECVGAVVEGCPPGQPVDVKNIQLELERRRPGQSDLVSGRKECDKLEVLSGLRGGKATGAPIRMLVMNRDVDSSPYDEIRNKPRPGHADFTAKAKHGGTADCRGGGIFSGRMTAPFVMAGAIAKQILKGSGIRVLAHVVQIGKVKATGAVSDEDIGRNTYKTKVRCADLAAAKKMEHAVKKAKVDGDSLGGLIECRILGVQPGIGEPLFDSIESVMSHLLFSIPGVKGVEFGSGFGCVGMKGSEHNDPFVIKGGRVATETNNAGGILGGISSGMPIVFRVAVKPTSSIRHRQRTVDLERMEGCDLVIKGRHDPCIAIRAVPVVESVAAIGLADLLLRHQKKK